MFKFLCKWLHNDSGEAYVGEAVKICVAVVLGAALLTGLVFINRDTLLPRVEGKIRELFFFATAKISGDEAYWNERVYGDLYSDDNSERSNAWLSVLSAAGVKFGEPSGDELLAGMEAAAIEKYGSREAYDALSEDERADFNSDYIASYATAHGVDINATNWTASRQEMATALYETVAPMSEEEYAALRAEAASEGVDYLPKTPWQSEEDVKAWLNTGDGWKYWEYACS